ncbi:MAG TPA: DNA internalization-related competence protein ComEC/Rec2 [Oceanospirillaceae bacterium]|nr:DNA internalization-related competence protein ComEC/Rec2 [Oceanospirillaceae bacterium]
MYINGLFLLLFWCLGWSAISFNVGVALMMLLGAGVMAYKSHQKLMVSALLLFLVASMGQYQRLNSQFPFMWVGKDLAVTGCVTDLRSNATGLSIELDTHTLPASIKVTSYRHTAAAQPQWLTLAPKPKVSALIGRQVSLLVRLKGARNYANPSSFDYHRWSQVEGRYASGYVKQWISTGEPCVSWQWPLWQLRKLRFDLWQALQTLPISPTATALWGGLILGQSEALSSSQWRVLAATGTTHLLVISGLHVGLVALMAMALVRLLLMPFVSSGATGLRTQAWAGVLAALTFALLSGFGLPAQRAVIMLLGLMWGQLWGLQLSFSQRLFMAFAITLSFQPSSATSLGLWLSYTAVLALGLVWYRAGTAHWWRKSLQLLAAQAALSVLVLPVIALATGQVSLVAPLINLLLVPLFSLVVIPLLMLVSLVALVVTLPTSVLVWVDSSLSLIWQVLRDLAQWPWAQVSMHQAPEGIWVGLIVVASASLMARRWLGGLVGLFLGLLILANMVYWQPQLGPDDERSKGVILTLFDVGQGLSVWLQHGDQHLIYDLGNRYRSGFNLVDAVVLPELREAGVNELHTVVVGHWDKDHSGGLEALLAQMPVQHLLLPTAINSQREVPLELNTTTVKRCRTDKWQTWSEEPAVPIQWRQIALADAGLRGNNASCIVLLSIYGRQVMIAGDIEARAETQLLRQYIDGLTSDILIAPHHGSNSSSTAAFLQRVAPSYVLISAGLHNAFGHPRKVVTRRYWQFGSHWYNTAQHGQVVVTIEPNGDYQVQPFLP